MCATQHSCTHRHSRCPRELYCFLLPFIVSVFYFIFFERKRECVCAGSNEIHSILPHSCKYHKSNNNNTFYKKKSPETSFPSQFKLIISPFFLFFFLRAGAIRRLRICHANRTRNWHPIRITAATN